MKVKMLYGFFNDEEYSTDITEYTDWVEVSDEEFELLCKYVVKYNQHNNHARARYCIVKDCGPSKVKRAIDEMKADLYPTIEKLIERDKKMEEAKKKRLATMAAKKEAKEKAKFEELKKKYE